MLNNRLSHVHDLIREAAAHLGNSAPRVADSILEAAFPETFSASEREGAETILRNGFIDFIKPLLSRADDAAQISFDAIEPSFLPIVGKLKRGAYYVPSEAVYVSVPGLIAEPELLNEARKFERQKGEETIAQAAVLDELYAAVVEASAA